MAEILTATDAVKEGGGCAVFLLGEGGSGKTSFLGVFEELAHRRHPDLQTGSAICATDGFTPSAWHRLDEHFTYSTRIRRAALKVIPEWLQVIPIVGGVASAAMVTIQRLRGGSVPRVRHSRAPRNPTTLDHVRSLAEHGKKVPCLVMLDQFERASADDLAGASALIRLLPETQIVAVFAVRTVKGRPPEAVRSLMLEAERKGRSRQLELKGFDRDELLELVSLIVRGMILPSWLDWLESGSGGRPARFWDMLGHLEHTGRLKRMRRSWEFAGGPPEPVDSTPDDRESMIGQVAEENRQLLAIAAIEGREFHSTVLAELAGLDELELEDRLAPLARTRVITHLGDFDLGSELTSRYAFESAGAARAFLSLLPADQRAALEVRMQEIRRNLGAGLPG